MTMVKVVDAPGNRIDNAPIWRVIAQSIEADIRGRRLNPGDKLPTEAALARRFMVNRHTVRKALKALAERSLIEATQGRGSFVRRPAIPFKIGRRVRFSEVMSALGAGGATRTLAAGVRAAGQEVARGLGLKPGDPVIVIERLGLAAGEPVSLSRHHFSHARFPDFIAEYERCGSITATLAAAGVEDYVRLRTRITARAPTVEECELLHLPRHVPLLITLALNRDACGAPLEYGEARFAADRIELDVELDAAS